MKGMKPSIQEAAIWISKSLTDQYKRECMAWWREKYGADYVAAVELTIKESNLKKKGKKP